MKMSKFTIITSILISLLLAFGTACFFEYKLYKQSAELIEDSSYSEFYFPIKTAIHRVQRYFITKDVGVIVRSVGERTEKPCIEDLQKWFGKDDVYVIKNVTPLAKASQQTMEYIQKTDKKWFLVVDADVLFFEDKLLLFIKDSKKISKRDPKAMSFQGLLYDKLLFKDRRVGFILYNKKNLKYEKEYMDQCYNAVRPDTCLRKQLIKSGYHAYLLNSIRIGLHAFNQYPKTTVKNGIMYAKKHDISDLRKVWKEKSSTDKDMQYVLLGVQIYDSLKDKNIVPDNDAMEELMKKYKLPELPYKSRETMDKNIRKYNDSTMFVIVDEE